MIEQLVAEELDLLERVRSRLAQRPVADNAPEARLERELEALREQILGRREAKDAMALHEQWHRQSAILRQLRASRGAPQVDPRSPYFAHLRLREDGRERDLCLGHATFIDGVVRIVDWRHAPVSQLFYRYGQGEAYEEEIAGRQRVGEVLARRTVAIRDTVLERIEAPEGVYAVRAGAPGGWERLEREAAQLAGGEGAALRAHAPGEGVQRRLGGDPRGGLVRSDKRLPEITGLIDPSQFDLIARPDAGYLVIRGAAGSGKTTVALHRIAYLAYADPEIDSPRTLFVVFSPGLRAYVSHVLPALGVERVSIRTYEEWAAEQRRRHFPMLPEARRPDTPALVQRVKLHPALAAALAAQVAREPGPPTARQAVDDWASALSRPELLREAFADPGERGVSGAELEHFAEWSRSRNDELFRWLAGDEEASAALDPEDDALLLRAWQLRVGPLQTAGGRRLLYRHVAVDEVQDFSAAEVQVLLGCLEEGHSLTLAGDTQQHLASAGGFTSWSAFLAELGLPGAEVETLRISYRSSRQIVSFALEVLGALREDESPPLAPRSGPAVELFRFTDRGACVAHLADALRELAEREPRASVALLTPSAELSALYHDALARCDVPRLRRVRQQDFTFAPGVEVTEIEQVKGLEFDYVVLTDVTDAYFPETDAARRLLHVAATRAVHQLWLTCVGTPSSLVRSALAG